MTVRLFGSELAVRDYFPLLRWMIFTGVSLFGFALAWRYRLFQLMTAQDQSGISLFICLLYVAISAHCLVSKSRFRARSTPRTGCATGS
jgi:uncharacterized membrane protein AbrB (regulator of aidB expression)